MVLVRGRRPHAVVIVIMALGLVRCAAPVSTVAPFATDAVQRVENHVDRPSVVVLKDGSRFQTTLFEVKALGALRTERKSPYLVLGARGCDRCDADLSIYIHSPSDGPMQAMATQARHRYPGRVLAATPRGAQPIYQGVAFIGECLDTYNGAVWVQTERTVSADGTPGEWADSVLTHAYVFNDSLVVVRWYRAQVKQRLDELRRHEAAGRCRAIPPIERAPR